MIRKHLVIPDSHARPNENLRRFEWLGEMIMKEMPDVIVDIGDWWDMESLSSYDKGTRSFEGRRYKADIEAGHKAELLAFGPIIKYNNTRSKHKKKHYTPLIIRTLGNHEQRIAKVPERQSELEGTIGIEDVSSRLNGPLDIRTYPFLHRAIVDGVCYSHYFVSGIMGKPIGSAHLLLSKHYHSCTAGHAHSRDWAEGVRADGVRMRGLISGSYLDPDHDSHYADSQSQGLWWSGLHIKNQVNDGNYDLDEWSIDRIKRQMKVS